MSLLHESFETFCVRDGFVLITHYRTSLYKYHSDTSGFGDFVLGTDASDTSIRMLNEQAQQASTASKHRKHSKHSKNSKRNKHNKHNKQNKHNKPSHQAVEDYGLCAVHGP